MNLCVRTRAMPWAFTLRPVGAEQAWFVTRRLPVGAEQAWFITRPLPFGAGKSWFLARPLLFGLEARPTDGTFSKFIRRAMT